MLKLNAPVEFAREIKQSLGEWKDFYYTSEKLKLRHPYYTTALDEITRDEFERRSDRDFGARVIKSGKEFGKMLLVPAAVSGAFLGGISQDLDELYDGVMVGAALGFGAYALTKAKTFWEEHFMETSAKGRERYKFGVVKRLSDGSSPVFNGFMHSIPYAFTAVSIWLAAEFLPDYIPFQASHFGWAAWTGVITGSVHTLLDIRTSGGIYRELITRVHDIDEQRNLTIDVTDYSIGDT